MHDGEPHCPARAAGVALWADIPALPNVDQQKNIHPSSITFLLPACSYRPWKCPLFCSTHRGYTIRLDGTVTDAIGLCPALFIITMLTALKFPSVLLSLRSTRVLHSYTLV